MNGEPKPGATESKAAEKLWDLANGVTGFAVLQSIATTFVVSEGKIDKALNGINAHAAGIFGTLVFTAFYIYAVHACRKMAEPRDTAVPPEIWRKVTSGRIAAIVLFNSVTVLAFVGHCLNPR